MKSENKFSRKGTRSHVPCNSPSEPPSETEFVCLVQPAREAPARRTASRPPASTRGRWPLESYGRFPFRPTTPSRPPRCLAPKSRARRRRGGRRPPTPRDFGLRPRDAWYRRSCGRRRGLSGGPKRLRSCKGELEDEVALPLRAE